jgi:hypothetical protein
MTHRRIAGATVALAISFGLVTSIAGMAAAMPGGGHSFPKHPPGTFGNTQSALDAQEAQYAAQVSALNAGTVTLPPANPGPSALDKQSAQYAAQVKALDDGTASLAPAVVNEAAPPASQPLPAGSGRTFGYWLTIGVLSGLLALAMSTVTMLLRRRPRPQLSV